MEVEELKRNIVELASDRYQGRFPNTVGETLTLELLEREFKKVGAVPGNPNGTYVQEVPLMEIDSTVDRAELQCGAQTVVWNWTQHMVAISKREQPLVQLTDVPVVFVGYGITSEEYQWNDFDGVDVKGKVVIVIINDPGFHSKDPTLFRGTTMTYPGRWTYKYEEASRKGAAGVFIIHETAAAAYPWSVVVDGKNRPHANMVPKDHNNSRCAVEGWITTEAARNLFTLQGFDYDQIMKKACTREHKSFDLNCTLSITIKNKISYYKSHNVLAKIQGIERPDEYVIFSAHWDHLGTKNGAVFGGARDNASGTAGLIELARYFKQKPTKRSLLFFSSTAEEQGLLGAEWYATHPLYPLTKTADMLNIFGKMRDISFYGWGLCPQLEEYCKLAAEREGRIISPEPSPEDGLYFRSDHYPLCKVGVAGLFLAVGTDHVTNGKECTRNAIQKWTSECYHKPADRYEDWWDMCAMIDDLRLIAQIGYLLAEDTKFPHMP